MNTNKLIVCDDFTGDIARIRARALELDYYPVVHNGVTYSGVGTG